MPFSSLSDPVDLARAISVFDTIWSEVKGALPESQRETERTRIAYLVANNAPMALDEADLKQSVLLSYRGPAAA